MSGQVISFPLLYNELAYIQQLKTTPVSYVTVL